jgi:hypothetical protein
MTESKDPVVPEMRDRLQANRSGKLTSGQWLDIVLQPLGSIVVLLVPMSFILLPRLILFARAGWMLFFIIAVILLFTFIPRAYRYARAPVHFARLHAPADSPPFWAFWSALNLNADNGEKLSIKKRLAPRPIVQRDKAYIAYYLKDHNEVILLSIAPADHPRAEKWLPDKNFDARFNRRSRK